MRLTSRGVGLLATAAVLLMAAALFGIEELYAVAVACLVLVAGAAVWVRARRWELQTTRALVPPRVPAGSDTLVELVVHNAGRRRSPTVALRDRVERGRSSVKLALAPLEPDASVRTSYRLPAPLRGVFDVGPLEIELADPFGLLATRRPGVEASALLVHPRLVDLAGAQRSAGSELDAVDSRVARAAGHELATIREYRTGDDLRRVHWASTARLAELMVRQDEAPFEGRVTVAVDLRQQAWAGGGLETALSAAGSVLVAALRQGVEARLVTSAGAATAFGTGPGHRAAALDLLAAAATVRTAQQADRLTQACAAGPAVVVTAAGEPGRQLLTSLAGTAGTLTAIMVRPDRGDGRRDAAAVAGTRVLAIDTAEALARQWRSWAEPGR